MGTVNLDDRLDDSLLYALHSIEFLIEDTARFVRIDCFKIVTLPLNIHHDRECSLRVSALLRRYLVGTGYRKVTSCPQTDIIRQCSSRTVHEICDTLQTGQLHIVAVFILILIFNFIRRCAAREQTIDHKL